MVVGHRARGVLAPSRSRGSQGRRRRKESQKLHSRLHYLLQPPGRSAGGDDKLYLALRLAYLPPAPRRRHRSRLFKANISRAVLVRACALAQAEPPAQCPAFCHSVPPVIRIAASSSSLAPIAYRRLDGADIPRRSPKVRPKGGSLGRPKDLLGTERGVPVEGTTRRAPVSRADLSCSLGLRGPAAGSRCRSRRRPWPRSGCALLPTARP